MNEELEDELELEKILDSIQQLSEATEISTSDVLSATVMEKINQNNKELQRLRRTRKRKNRLF